jgi:hypothetical protein
MQRRPKSVSDRRKCWRKSKEEKIEAGDEKKRRKATKQEQKAKKNFTRRMATKPFFLNTCSTDLVSISLGMSRT